MRHRLQYQNLKEKMLIYKVSWTSKEETDLKRETVSMSLNNRWRF
jgi:hypothetical protein